jgi:carboxyl-terminal processing protease
VRAARRALAALALVLPLAAAAAPDAARAHLEDFDAMWRAIDRDYAFEGSRAAWTQARGKWRARAARARDPAQLAAALTAALDTLRDDRVTLAANGKPPTRVPYDIDIWPRWEKGGARVEAVRVFSNADVAGMLPGQPLKRIGDAPVERALRERLGHPPKDAAEAEWTMRRLLADLGPGPPRSPGMPAVSARRIGVHRDIGYVRLRIGVPEPHLDEQLNAAIASTVGMRALIVDVRDNAAPGMPDATQAALARLGARNLPTLVLVDRWTAGEGEALAAGLAATGHARLIGTRTAGVRGEVHDLRLPHSGFVVSYPVRAAKGSAPPRRPLDPDVAIDLAAPRGGPGDPILYEALKLLE